MSEHPFIKHVPKTYPEDEILKRSADFYHLLDQRRSVRDFSDKMVPKEVIENIIMTASSAPSGAHKQPWTFCAISNKTLQQKIKVAAEEEEYKSYHGRMSEEWLKDLAPIGTDWHKEFLAIAPWIIVIFKKSYDLEGDQKKKNYYVMESVGIAAGFLISAIHNAGLVTLTHTPSPMNFLQEILERPANEKPFLLLPVGYPTKEAMVPDLARKSVDDVVVWY